MLEKNKDIAEKDAGRLKKRRKSFPPIGRKI
jgi:hypothetical protein